MYSMPTHTVPKAESAFQMVTNHSARKNSLNSMISQEEIEGCSPLDSLKPLGDTLLVLCDEYGSNEILILFKSDVQSAYCLTSMNFFWQLMQVVMMPNGDHHIDRCNVFGNKASSGIWIGIMLLMTWIAVFIKFIHDIFQYSDDIFGVEHACNMTWYEPYQAYFPFKASAASLSLR
ncbi:hypothetical protein BDQ17DRAFT_1272432 [Cyathus striatus]|nr:hypothetical protein BDQ17DRAFT_1272432 [Cyathus striatus]